MPRTAAFRAKFEVNSRLQHLQLVHSLDTEDEFSPWQKGDAMSIMSKEASPIVLDGNQNMAWHARPPLRPLQLAYLTLPESTRPIAGVIEVHDVAMRKFDQL